MASRMFASTCSRVAPVEMQRTFNLGVGMLLAVAPADVARAITALQTAGETAFRCGEIIARRDAAVEIA